MRKPPKFDVFLNPAKKEDQESIERAMTLKFRFVIRNDRFNPKSKFMAMFELHIVGQHFLRVYLLPTPFPFSVLLFLPVQSLFLYILPLLSLSPLCAGAVAYVPDVITCYASVSSVSSKLFLRINMSFSSGVCVLSRHIYIGKRPFMFWF